MNNPKLPSQTSEVYFWRTDLATNAYARVKEVLIASNYLFSSETDTSNNVRMSFKIYSPSTTMAMSGVVYSQSQEAEITMTTSSQNERETTIMMAESSLDQQQKRLVVVKETTETFKLACTLEIELLITRLASNWLRLRQQLVIEGELAEKDNSTVIIGTTQLAGLAPTGIILIMRANDNDESLTRDMLLKICPSLRLIEKSLNIDDLDLVSSCTSKILG